MGAIGSVLTWIVSLLAVFFVIIGGVFVWFAIWTMLLVVRFLKWDLGSNLRPDEAPPTTPPTTPPPDSKSILIYIPGVGWKWVGIFIPPPVEPT